jgi:uncharacterized protein (DUF427 family)
MAQATWQGVVLAQSDETIEIEGNQYFPPGSVDRQYLEDSATHSTCPWKGEASFYTIVVNENKNPDAAWYYPAPKEAAAEIKGYVAFWKGVSIS